MRRASRGWLSCRACLPAYGGGRADSLPHRHPPGVVSARVSAPAAACSPLPALRAPCPALQPGSISTLLCTYMLPLKYNLPSAAVVLLAMLHSTLRQCTAECRGSQQPAAALRYAGARRGGRQAAACRGTRGPPLCLATGSVVLLQVP